MAEKSELLGLSAYQASVFLPYQNHVLALLQSCNTHTVSLLCLHYDKKVNSRQTVKH